MAEEMQGSVLASPAMRVLQLVDGSVSVLDSEGVYFKRCELLLNAEVTLDTATPKIYKALAHIQLP